jgi:hypothetical protein
MINRIAPLLLDAAGKMASDALQVYIQRRAAPTISGSSECPYCELTRMVVLAHRYASRAKDKPDKGRMYSELARMELGDATYFAQRMPQTSMRDLVLKRLDEQSSRLHRGHDLHTLASVVSELWSISEITLDLAE